MLGFRRRKQAQSIAHGCASTLAQLYAESKENPAAWTSGWGVRGTGDMDPASITLDKGCITLQPQKDKPAGECWFRKGAPCPFSPTALKSLGLKKRTVEQVAQIYKLCGEAETHCPAEGPGQGSARRIRSNRSIMRGAQARSGSRPGS
jgi:hypothetical protein